MKIYILINLDILVNDANSYLIINKVFICINITLYT